MVVPLIQAPSQTMQIALGGQKVILSVYQKSGRVYVDTTVGGVPLSTGIVALNLVPVIPQNHAEFVGNMGFVDILGESDPVYTEFGTRYFFMYLEASDYG